MAYDTDILHAFEWLYFAFILALLTMLLAMVVFVAARNQQTYKPVHHIQSELAPDCYRPQRYLKHSPCIYP